MYWIQMLGRSWIGCGFIVLCSALASGCQPDDEGSTGQSTLPITSVTNDSTSALPTGETGGATGGETGGATGEPFPASECDPLVQDCPDDELCLPALHAEDFNFVCYPPTYNRGLFEYCKGHEWCAEGMLCVDKDLSSSLCTADLDAVVGRCCLPFCNTADPECPDISMSCDAIVEKVTMSTFKPEPEIENLGLCVGGILRCNPVDLESCGTNKRCTTRNSDDPTEFACWPIVIPEPENAFCVPFADYCTFHELCAPSVNSKVCDTQEENCCARACDTTLPPDCTYPEQVCIPWFGDDPPPPDLANLGYCGFLP